jgi:excisionase family DNA binding protein
MDGYTGMTERVYTTLDIAKVCRVSLRTVIRWVDDGRLSSFRTPGGHRRVKEQDLANFLTRYNIPFSIHRKQESKKILIMEPQDTVQRILQKLLRRASDAYEIFTADNPYELAIRIGTIQPQLVILSLREITPEIEALCRVLRRIPETKRTRLLVVNTSMGTLSGETLRSTGVDAVVMRPSPENTLREQVLKLLEESEVHTH